MLDEATIEFYSPNQREDYTKFLLNRADSNIYHTIEWKEVIDEFKCVEPNYLIARDKLGIIRSVLPLYYVKNFTGKKFDSIPVSMYGGIIGDKYYVKLLIKKALELQTNGKCNYLLIRQSSSGYNKIFNELNMASIKKRYCQYIKIKDPNILWKNIKNSHQRAIKKAIENKIIIYQAKNKKEIIDFYKVALINGKRIGYPIQSISFFYKIWDVMYQKGLLEIFLAKYKDKTIAANLVFTFNKKAICGYTYSDTNYLNLRPNDLMIWEIQKWCFNNNLIILDLGTTPSNNTGLYFFKSKFGALDSPIIYYYYPKNSNVKGDVEKVGVIGSKILKKIPICISKRINPYLIQKFA